MLIIVNPYATTVSVRLKNLVVYALQGRYDVTAVETTARGHATELCREAARRGLRRRGRLRRRRHRQRGRQRPRRRRRPADLPARRRHERLLQDARHPRRDRRRHRAPAADGRRLAPAARRPRPRQRPALHVLGRASGSTPASSSASTATRAARRASAPAYFTWAAITTFLGALRLTAAAAGRSSCPTAAASTASPRSSRTATRSPTSATARSTSPTAGRIDDGVADRRRCCAARPRRSCRRSSGAPSADGRGSAATARSTASPASRS